MRLRTAAAMAATTAIGAGAAAVAAGRYASDFALKPSRDGAQPEPPLTVQAAGDTHVTLTRTLASARPGVYGLCGSPGSSGLSGDVHATVGDVLSTAPGSVTRSLRPTPGTPRGRLTPGAVVRLTPQAYAGDPREALGLDFDEVRIPGELGPLPAWFLPGARDVWAITVHGLGTTREHPLVVMAALHHRRLPVLNITYRNDAGAPRSPDGIGHLGDTEWHDLDAAIRYAVRHGARRVLLYGWSTGATMALRAADHSPLSDRVNGLILDSPVLDWQTTLRASAAGHGVPGLLLPLAVRAAEGRTGLHAARLADSAEPARLRVPTLIFHGPDDTLAPWAPSRRLAAARPDLVSLHSFPGAPHAAMWNRDPHRYEETLRRFLIPLV
jgi:pimeloyl-ACP methyl ester carboxylesterase